MTLPNRRMGVTQTIVWQDNEINVTFNHDEDGEIIEMFFKGVGKEGTALQDALDELGWSHSKLIQYGMTIERMYEGLRRDGKQALVASALELVLK